VIKQKGQSFIDMISTNWS